MAFRIGEPLFSKYDLFKFSHNHTQKLVAEINGYEAEYLLSVSPDELQTYLMDKYQLRVPKIQHELIEAQNPAETLIEYETVYDNDIIRQAGTAYTFFIPFIGDSDLFHFRPSHYDLNSPKGVVHRGQLELTYKMILIPSKSAEREAKEVRKEFDDDFAVICEHLSTLEKDVQSYNETFALHARTTIESRRAQLLKNSDVASLLGLPIRERPDAPKTFNTSEIRRKITPVSSQPLPRQSAPEPALDMELYEHILTVLSSMVRVMELSPKAFIDMKEEELRTLFLVSLNSHYEGAATGETFNVGGKTDILVRVGGKNIFIAECKNWGGAETLSEAIDQLLGYTSWRDTKVALLIFNRNKNFSAVLKEIPRVIEQHQNTLRKVNDTRTETSFRYVLHHRDDKERELILTVLAFDVPR